MHLEAPLPRSLQSALVALGGRRGGGQTFTAEDPLGRGKHSSWVLVAAEESPEPNYQDSSALYNGSDKT